MLSRTLQRSQRVQSPFLTLKTLIEARYRGDPQFAAKIYTTLTFTDPAADQTRKICRVAQHLCHLPCEPGLYALMLWSKIKFQLLQLKVLPNDLKLLLLGFVREVEQSLESGLLLHFGGVTTAVTNMDYNDFCEYTIMCSHPV
jgi:hypothetical protein